MIPKANEIFRHFKGNLYKVLTIATDSESNEKVVVYQALYGSFQIYCRPLEMFCSKVDRRKYPNASQEYRFEKVEEIIDLQENLKKTVDSENEKEDLSVFENSDGFKEQNQSDTEGREILVEPLKSEEDFDDDEEEFHVDPLVMEFLDADSVKERKNILAALHHRITEDMIYTLALAMDIVIDEGNLEERYEQLMYCLNTKEKYEIERQ